MAKRKQKDLRHWEYLHELTHSNKTVEQVEAKVALDKNYISGNPVLERAIRLYERSKPTWHKVIRENYNTKFIKVKTSPQNEQQHQDNPARP